MTTYTSPYTFTFRASNGTFLYEIDCDLDWEVECGAIAVTGVRVIELMRDGPARSADLLLDNRDEVTALGNLIADTAAQDEEWCEAQLNEQGLHWQSRGSNDPEARLVWAAE